MIAARPCPCGCGSTREEAVREMMSSASAMNRDQAEAALDRVEKEKQ